MPLKGSIAVFFDLFNEHKRYLLLVGLLLAQLAAPPRADGGLELLEAGGQHGAALRPLLLR